MKVQITVGVALVLLLSLMFWASCANKGLLPYVGKWTGGFVVDDAPGGGSARDRARNDLHGYLQLYRSSFQMDLEGEQEGVLLKGTWAVKGKDLMLTPTDLSIDDHGGADQRNPNLKFIPPDDVRAAYAHPLALKISPDKKRLLGLEISMGKLLGRHLFAR